MAPYTHNGRTVYYYGDHALEKITDIRSVKRRAQVFSEILKECSGSHFQDPEFPHDDKSVGDYDQLFDTANPKMAARLQEWKNDGWSGASTWIRVADVCKRLYEDKNVPTFNDGDIGQSEARNDILQGSVGDCWFLCSLSAVSMVPELITFVVPDDNKTNDEGVYHFRFWYQGTWVDVVVDDYLPCIVTREKTVIIGSNFAPENGKAEFWAILLEKAFAKLVGDYAHIAGNIIMYALESLIGGFGNLTPIKDGKLPDGFFPTMEKWIEHDCVLGATAGFIPNELNIIGNHAYSVTGARVVTTTNGEKHEIMRLRNPWGKSEWKGDWADDSALWQQVSAVQKQEIGLITKDEGEFWMSYEDFKKYFMDISCCWYWDQNEVNCTGAKYNLVSFQNEWNVCDNTAVGWDKPWRNPHFLVEMTKPENGLLIVGVVIQNKMWEDLDDGYTVRLFPVSGETTFDKAFFQKNEAHEIYPEGLKRAPGNTLNSMSVHYKLKAGKYLVVPTTLSSGTEFKFCVRILNEGNKATAVPPADLEDSASESDVDGNQ